MIGAYRDAGGRGDLALQVHLSWAPDEREAEALAYDQWRSNVFPPPVCWDVDLAATFDAISEDVPLERVKQLVNVSSDLGAHTAQLAEYAELGFDKIMLAPCRAGAGGVRGGVRREGPSPAASLRHETDEDLRPVVEERRRLLPGRRDLRRRQRRRMRRLPRPHPADRPPGPARGHLHLADAVLPVPGPRRRLRHHRLLRRRPAAGHARRLRRVRPHRPRPRHAGDRGPRGQPHLGPAPVVRRGAQQPRLAQARLVHLGRRGARRRGPGRRVPRPGDERLGARQADRPVLPAPVLQAPARPERREPGGPRRDRPDHGLLDRSWACPGSGWTR